MTTHPSPAGAGRARAASLVLAALVALVSVAPFAHAQAPDQKKEGAKPAATRPALTVETVTPQAAVLPSRVPANGSIAAWQEAIVGAEIGGLRLQEVRVNVGDAVKAGEVLAVFAAETVQADLALQRAALTEAEATLAEAAANAARAREVKGSGAMSEQQIGQLLTAETTARARVEAARAQVQAQELRMRHTRVLAPDAGVISARSATVGGVAQAGQELFRMIRRGRLEWRAEVPEAALHRVRAGQTARIVAPSGEAVDGRVRIAAPTVDTGTRNALVYVDLLPGTHPLRAGMFARGEIVLGETRGMTLPPSAVLLREGFAYVFRLGPGGRVAQTKVTLGRRDGDRIEILDGLAPDATVVRSGVAFLADGDTVKVVASPTPAASAR